MVPAFLFFRGSHIIDGDAYEEMTHFVHAVLMMN
jgi:hypothetical protein